MERGFPVTVEEERRRRKAEEEKDNEGLKEKRSKEIKSREKRGRKG